MKKGEIFTKSVFSFFLYIGKVFGRLFSIATFSAKNAEVGLKAGNDPKFTGNAGNEGECVISQFEATDFGEPPRVLHKQKSSIFRALYG